MPANNMSILIYLANHGLGEPTFKLDEYNQGENIHIFLSCSIHFLENWYSRMKDDEN